MNRAKGRIGSSFILTMLLLIMLVLTTGIVNAKTTESQAAKTVFFYTSVNGGKEDILLKAMDIAELQELTKEATANYNISCTDRLPTTCYAEAKGFTLDALLAHISKTQALAQNLTFQGGDTMSFMADDSGNQYTKSLKASDATVERKYTEGLYEGWNKFGASKWMSGDNEGVNAFKKTAWSQGEKTPVILSTSSFSGRTTELSQGSESSQGIKEYVEDNGNTVKGCLSRAKKLNENSALTLYLPTTESEFMEGEATAANNFRWIYSIKLAMEQEPELQSQGTVENVKAQYKLSSDAKTLTVTLSCATDGADIYYDPGNCYKDGNINKSAQTLYKEPLTIDVSDRDLASDPLIFYTRAVKAGYSDGGNQTMVYYPAAPNIGRPARAWLGEEDVTLAASETVSGEEWKQWTSSITGIAVKTTSEENNAYANVTDYIIDNEKKTITLPKGNFLKPATYSIRITAENYRTTTWNATVIGRAPTLQGKTYYDKDQDITVTFPADQNSTYHDFSTVKMREAGDDGKDVTINSSYWTAKRGEFKISSKYFSSRKSGDYILTLSNSDYDPGSQEIRITLIHEKSIAAAKASINAIGTVDENSGTKIKAARTAYNVLTQTEQGMVDNLEVLTGAETAYAPFADDARERAKSELQDYKAPEAYRVEQQQELHSIITKVQASMETAEYVEDIRALLSDGKKQIDALKTDAQLKKEEAISKARSSLGTITGVKALSTTYNTTKISWSKKTTAKGYMIYRAVGKNGGYSKIATVSRNSTLSVTDKNLKTGTLYYYKVCAYTVVENTTVTGTFSTSKWAKPALKKVSVKVQARKSQAALRWKKVLGADGYQIYRSTKKSSGYKNAKTITKGSTIKYTNKKLKKGKRYYYKVRAYRKVSGKKVYGSFSAVKSVKVK